MSDQKPKHTPESVAAKVVKALLKVKPLKPELPSSEKVESTEKQKHP
jgi:hypothetical protein